MGAWCHHQLVPIVLCFLFGGVLAGVRQSLQEVWDFASVIRLPEREDQVIQSRLVGWIVVQNQPTFLYGKRSLSGLQE